MSSFGSMNTIRSGLAAAQRGLDVVGQNIANASTAGYSRQAVSMTASEPEAVIHSAGRGVRDVNLVRYRDEFLDRQFRSRAGLQGYHDTRSQSLGQVEEIMGTLGEGGLRTSMDQFFNAWDALALHPSDATARNQVVVATETFLRDAKQVHMDLLASRDSTDEKIRGKVADINAAGEQLAELNQEMLAARGTQAETSGLKDRRDLLLDSLAKLAGVTVGPQPDGTVTVYVGSLPLVEGGQVHRLDLSAGPEATQPNQWITTVTWNGQSITPSFSGEVGALLELRDKTVPTYMSYIDHLVRTVGTEVNALHNPGGTGTDFFVVGGQWMNIDLNPTIQSNPAQIVAAGTLPAAAGDGERARQIAALRAKPMLTGAPVGTRVVSPGEYLQSIQGGLGLEVQAATRRSDSAKLQVEQAEKQRQGVSGVSLDEEMTRMVQFQQTYSAAAKVMNALSEMLDTVINRLGQ